MQKLNLYSTSSFPLFKDYMETRRSDWDKGKDSTEEQVRYMTLNKYNNFLTSGRWSKDYHKDY